MNDLRRISIIAVILLVILRLALGWQLLYEGLWKLSTQKTAKPWTAEPYLKNAQGPMRDYFRNMTGDPDDLNWLNYEKVSHRWDVWSKAFESFYQLDDKQKASLDKILNGRKDFYAPLAKLPEGVTMPLKSSKFGELVWYNKEKKRLEANPDLHVTPSEIRKLNSMVDPENKENEAYLKAIARLKAISGQMSKKDELLVLLKGDPDRAGAVNPKQEGTIDHRRIGEMELYEDLLARYENKLANAKIDFQYNHLNYDFNELNAKKSAAIGPVKALEADLHAAAEKLLTIEQISKGPLPLPVSDLKRVDLMTMWALTIIGALLLSGLFSQCAAAAGAFLIFNFYMAYPPIPGYPEPPGVEHAVIVNKNLIEVLALLGLAAIPSGRWFGLDSILFGFFDSKVDPDRK